jgi:hypothetical protein
MVPRDGGNTFEGHYYGAFANHSMQGDNVTQDLKNRGLLAPNSLKQYKEFNPFGGGRIVRDKLWFFGTARYNRATDYSPIYYNLNAGDPTSWTYAPDISRGPASDDNTWKSYNARLTWQATTRNKIGITFDGADSCPCPRNLAATMAPEANVTSYAPIRPGNMLFLDWTAPLTNRLLIEAGFMKRDSQSSRPGTNIYFTHDPGPGVLLNGVLEQSTGLNYRASASIATSSRNPTRMPRMTASYITGAHAFKVGFNLGFQSQEQKAYSIDSPMSFRFNNGVPNQLTLQATPYETFIDEQDHGMFVQDRWTVNRMTVTGGVRYDYFHVSFPEQSVGPGRFVPTRNLTFPAAEGVTWHDLGPRVGVAYDLFGDGKTALKFSANKYLAFFGAPNASATFDPVNAFTTSMNPTTRLVNSTTRSWNDSTFAAGDPRRGNLVPDCDLLNPAANGECGAMANPDFGTTRPGSSLDPATVTGWNKRPNSNWQFSAGVQREIVPRVSVDVSYYRTIFTNLVVQDDRAVGPADFDAFSITAPSDSRLPNGGGYTVSGLFNLKPTSFGRAANNLITYADNYGRAINHWNGVDVTFVARLRAGLTFQGGTSSGRSSLNYCDVYQQLPEILLSAPNLSDTNNNAWLPAGNCDQTSAWLTQVKLLGTYLVPKVDVQLSATFQSLPGPQIWANFTATNAIVSPSLGRNLSGNAANIVVNIVEPGKMYGERLNQVDVRIAKILKYGRIRTTAGIDLYNLLNANPVLTQSNTFGNWQTPQKVLGPRFVELVLKLDF